MRRALAATLLISGCASARPEGSREVHVTGPAMTPEAAKFLARVQAAACFRPAETKQCTPGLEVRFGPDDRSALTCDDGQPIGHFVGLPGAADHFSGPVPLPVWEALERVLQETASCVAFDGKPVRVSREGKVVTCEAPSAEIARVIRAAASHARVGPPAVWPPPPEEAVCAIDPSACPSGPTSPPPRAACPPFQGDIWSGLRASPRPAVEPVTAEDRPEAPADEGTSASSPRAGGAR